MNVTKRAFLGACGIMSAAIAVPAGMGQAHAEGFKIGISLPSQIERRWVYDAQYMSEAAKAHGAETIVQYANLKPETQATQIENMLSQQIDVLIVTAVDAAAGAAPVMMAKAQGIPVIAYDLAITNADIDVQIARDNRQVGELQAKAALDAVGPGQYAIVRGDPSNTVSQQIGEAQAALLGSSEGVEVVSDQWATGWSPAAAMSMTENLLSRTDDGVKAFIVANDGMAGGVVQALAGRGLNGKVFVTGMDADPAGLARIVTGDQNMTVYTDIRSEAEAAITAAVALMKGEAPDASAMTNNGYKDVPTVQVSSTVINRDNICQFITEMAPEGWVQMSDVFPSDPDACK